MSKEFQYKQCFEGQKTYENPVLVLRRHWIVLLMIFIAYLFLAMLPFVIEVLIDDFLEKSNGLYDVYWLVTIAYFMVWWYGLFYQLTDYILDIWIVTDHRVVDTEQRGLFDRNIAETNLANVQDVTVVVRGLFETFFNYGNVSIQTAGPLKELIFHQVPNPVYVKEVILHMYEEYVRTHPNKIEYHHE